MKKTCSSCKETKPKSEFNRSKHTKDKLTNRCKACNKKYLAIWRKNNPHYSKNWYKNNPGYHKEWVANKPGYHNKRDKERRRTDLSYKLRRALRNRFKSALRIEQKNGSAIKELGCSIQELKDHLESRFQPGMSWNNYGEWHIDHIKPLSSFNLEDKEQIKQACHYTNLQPLWAKENLQKGNRG